MAQAYSSGPSCPRDTSGYLLEVQKHFASSDPDKLAAFNAIFRDAALDIANSDSTTTEPTARETRMLSFIRPRLSSLFATDPDLITGFETFWAAAQQNREDTLAQPHMAFSRKVHARFKEDPERLGKWMEAFNEVVRGLLEGEGKDPMEVWREVYGKARKVLEGEGDLEEEFEGWYKGMVEHLQAAKAVREEVEKEEKEEDKVVKTAQTAV